MQLASLKKYINLLQNVSSKEALPFVLELARRGEIDLRVALTKNILARRAPCNLSNIIVDAKGTLPQLTQFAPLPYIGYSTVIDELKKSSIGLESSTNESNELPEESNKQNINKNIHDIFAPPSQLLPGYYDIRYFRVSDFVYIDAASLYDLEKVGRAEINAFIHPQSTFQSIENTLSLYGRSIIELDLDPKDYGAYPLDLPHSILRRIGDIHAVSHKLKSIAFYPLLQDSYMAYSFLQGIIPISVHAAKSYLSITPEDFLDRPSYCPGNPWGGPLDENWLLDNCCQKITSSSLALSMYPMYIIEFISHIDKWLPLNPIDSKMIVTTENLYIEQYDLSRINEIYAMKHAAGKRKDKPQKNKIESTSDQVATQEMPNNDTGMLPSIRKWTLASDERNKIYENPPDPLTLVFDEVIRTPKNYEALRYKYIILAELIRQFSFKFIGEGKRYSSQEKFLHDLLDPIQKALGENNLFKSSLIDLIGREKKVTEREIDDIIKKVMSKNWPTNDKTLDY